MRYPRFRFATPRHRPVSVGEAHVGDLRCEAGPGGQTICTSNGGVDSFYSGPCVDRASMTWIAPGEAIDGRPVKVDKFYSDDSTGQSWALVNGNPVPVCYRR